MLLPPVVYIALCGGNYKTQLESGRTHSQTSTKGYVCSQTFRYEHVVPTAEFTVREPGPTSALSNDMLIK